MYLDKNAKQYMIGLDGGLRQIDGYLVDDLLKQGWKQVNNPKRAYYPEFDKTLKTNAPFNEKIFDQEEENTNYVEVKKL